MTDDKRKSMAEAAENSAMPDSGRRAMLTPKSASRSSLHVNLSMS